MSGISSSSGSGFLLDELLDKSGSWSLQTNDDDESNLNVLYGILGATGFFICLYSIRFWCDKKQANL
jgi:hypothetical protein